MALRELKKKGATQYTLKCRIGDRHLAAAARVAGRKRLEASEKKEKLEEDFAAGLRCRLSHSGTVTFKHDLEPDFSRRPKTLGEANQLFHRRKELELAGATPPKDPELSKVGGKTAYEMVHTGPRLTLPGQKKSAKAEIALVRGKRKVDKRHALKEKEMKREMDRARKRGDDD